jgi:EipB-like
LAVALQFHPSLALEHFHQVGLRLGGRWRGGSCRRRRIAAMMSRKLMACTIDPMPPRAQGAVMSALVRFAFAAALLGPFGAPASVAWAQVQPHRAEYALRLGAAANAPRIGTAVNDLSRDCAGWHLKRDIKTEIALTTSWNMSLASKLDAEEQRNGFHFSTVQIQNGSQREFQGKVQRKAGETRAEIVFAGSPPNQFVLPSPTLMPVAAIDHLIQRLQANAASFPALMFDGEVIGDAFLIDVTEQDRAALRAARPADRPVAMPAAKSWPVFMTFTRGRQQDQQPLFTVSALIFDNGVLDRLTVETGLLSVTADLQAVEMRPAPVCPRS